MKKMRLAACMLAVGILMAGAWKIQTDAGETKKVDVMFLHDTHSHLNEFTTVEDGKTQTLGGFAKIKTLINEQKEQNPETLLLDAGDFSMGTLVQVMYEEEASELRMLGELGIDAATLGNHEFDYKAEGLANMLDSAVASGEELPAMVVCNVDWDAMEEQERTAEQTLLWEAFENYGVEDYIVVEKNGVRIAVTGVFGIDSLNCTPNCPIEFSDPIEAVAETVEEIQAKEMVDMIVCLSHSGTSEEEEKSEDENLAKSVPALDLIISGHTHTKLEQAIVHGDTTIVSCGEYGKYLGNLSMTQKTDGRWELDDYELVTVDESVSPDAQTQKKVDQFMDRVDEKYLAQFGYTRDQVLCTNEVEFVTSADTSKLHTELNLGSIMADAYTYAVEQAPDYDGHPVDVAVVPAGVIRDSYALGDITTEQVYNSFSLGIGADGVPGYPLISVYLTGEELKTAAELDASISDLMTAARLYTDGLCWNYNPHRLILNKVTDVYICNSAGERVELEDEKLYRVVTDYYTSQMLGSVTKLSYGLLSIVPKLENGEAIQNYEDAVIHTEGRELKAWAAIASYMESFEDTDGDGIANVPLSYGETEGRKVVENSRNIADLLKHPNQFFWMILGVIAFVIVIFVGIILLIRRVLKKRKERKVMVE